MEMPSNDSEAMGMNDGNVPMDDNMGGMQDAPQNQFDTNFDAGVEANEETDPKKYIQQLTGKLSQSLRSYNENLPQPDADLDKYVAGMIIKQAIEGLSPEDTNEILDKVKNDGEETPTENAQDEMPQQQGNEMDDGIGDDMGMQESVNKQKIDEIFNQVMQDKSDADDMQKPVKNIGYRKKPFTSPRFK